MIAVTVHERLLYLRLYYESDLHPLMTANQLQYAIHSLNHSYYHIGKTVRNNKSLFSPKMYTLKRANYAMERKGAKKKECNEDLHLK